MQDNLYDEYDYLDPVESIYDSLYPDDLKKYYLQESHGFLGFFTGSLTFSEVWNNCILSSIKDVLDVVLPVISLCLLTNFISWLGELPSKFLHWSSTITGLLCMYHVFHNNMIHSILFALIIFLCFHITALLTNKFYGVVVSLVCIIYLIISEFVVDRKIWHQVRGSQMLIAMKVISVGFDIDKRAFLNIPSVPQYFGYCFFSGNVIFGPWISFKNYQRILQMKVFDWRWILKMVVSFGLALLCLLISGCISQWVIAYNSNKWLLAYRDAFSFRFSHYFISFLSESTLLSSGWGLLGDGPPDKKSISVAQPFHIEFPRSLVEVVIHWNLPMHYWLKTYVFKTARPLGNFLAIIFTYAASSLLHGLNFQLAAVLLSLGFYSFIEHALRYKLAKIFKSCILVRKCYPSCVHHYKHTHPIVRLVNLGFGVLSIFHLTYLGLMFDSSNLEEEGYNMMHTLEKWSELSYCSHWVALTTLGFHLLL